MTQNYEFKRQGKITFSSYLVVVEFFTNGYILAIKGYAEEAESLAREIATHINSNYNEIAEFKEAIKPYRVIREYKVNENTSIISNAVWCDIDGCGEVYVVGINHTEGGIAGFILERENYSLLLSIEDHINRHERVTSMFKDFVFCAN